MKIDNLCRVLRELRDTGPMTNGEMCDVLDVSRHTAWHWIAKLQAWGMIRQNGMRGRQYLYELAPRDQPLGTPYIRRAKRESQTPTGRTDTG